MIFDRMFGTYTPEVNESDIRYGLVHPNLSRNPLSVVFHNWRELLSRLRQVRGASNKMMVILARPGNVPPVPLNDTRAES